MSGMTKSDAMSAHNEIEAVCKKHSLFRTVQQVKKPHLEQIKMEISIKVDEERK